MKKKLVEHSSKDLKQIVRLAERQLFFRQLNEWKELRGSKTKILSDLIGKYESIRLKVIKEIVTTINTAGSLEGSPKNIDFEGWVEMVRKKNIDSKLRHLVDLLEKLAQVIDQIESTATMETAR